MKEALLKWLRLNNDLTVKVYNGYGHTHRLVLHGHVFNFSPLPRSNYSRNPILNFFSLIRLFFVKPVPAVKVTLKWYDQQFEAETAEDGFFRFEWESNRDLEPGWHDVKVFMNDNGSEIAGGGKVLVPESTQYAIISDIDDTFLISHSATILKRLMVLFTHNARSRKPFADVVKHYQLLSTAHTTPDNPNPFFYVSSSEWNLYDYIAEFARVNKLPEGVFLLNQVKQWFNMWKTGKTKHHGKFARIVRIMEAFPHQRIILLGDSSQADPEIYASIVQHFPDRVHVIYIRDVYAKNRDKVRSTLAKLEGTGVPCCFFQNSEDAIRHSQKIALIGDPAGIKN